MVVHCRLEGGAAHTLRYARGVSPSCITFTTPPQKPMAVKKSEQCASLWKRRDELRGGMDASQYKDYVLVLLFMKYVSDRYAGDPDGQIFVPEGSRFSDLVALKIMSRDGMRRPRSSASG